MTGFMDISWMAVLLHVRNYGIMSTTNASKTLSGPADFAALRKKVLGFPFLINKAISLGIIEPLDLATDLDARHTHIPLHQTPSLEYHPVYPS